MTMCHVPPADPASATTIEVESADVARHMDQGDRLGPCTAEDLACTPLGQPCTEDAECCTESCLGERCNPHCRPSGAACETDGNCCSDDCNKGHCRS